MARWSAWTTTPRGRSLTSPDQELSHLVPHHAVCLRIAGAECCAHHVCREQTGVRLHHEVALRLHSLGAECCAHRRLQRAEQESGSTDEVTPRPSQPTSRVLCSSSLWRASRSPAPPRSRSTSSQPKSRVSCSSHWTWLETASQRRLPADVSVSRLCPSSSAPTCPEYWATPGHQSRHVTVGGEGTGVGGTEGGVGGGAGAGERGGRGDRARGGSGVGTAEPE